MDNVWSPSSLVEPGVHPTTGKPLIRNPDGSVSTERTITYEDNGKFYNIPSIVSGVQLNPQQAITATRSGLNPQLGVFSSLVDAERAANERSRKLGQELNGTGH